MDDTILMGPDAKELDNMVILLKKTFQISDEGALTDYLGIKIDHQHNGTFRLTQPQLINSILEDLHLTDPCKRLYLPYLITKILDKDSEGAPFDDHFDYQLVIGMLLYLEKSMRPELAYAVHQCAQFCTNPKSHMGRKSRRLVSTVSQPETKVQSCIQLKKGLSVGLMHCTPENGTVQMPCWMQQLRAGYLITYAGCPVLWASKLQTKIALSSTKSKYIALSKALQEITPLITKINEAKQ